MSKRPMKLQEHFVVLCNKLDLNLIVPILRQEKMLTTDEHEKLLRSAESERTRREMLLLYLPKKGKDHFSRFCTCLVWSGQTDLAQEMNIDLSEIPPSPYPPPQQPREQQIFDMLQSLIRSPGMASLPPPVDVQRVQLEASPYPNPAPPPYYASATGHTPPATGHTPPTTSPAAVGTFPPDTRSGDPFLRKSSSVPENRCSAPELSGLRSNSLPSSAESQQQRVPSVFILYNKEESVGVTAEKYCDEVWALTELLHQIGGLTCEIDVLDKNGVVANWNVWTEQKIRESMFVVLVCSPTIAAACAHPEHKPISTLKGAFYADTIVNLIAAPKFIPVFLNRLPTDIYQWMPTNLHTATRYHINVEAFTERLGDTEGMLQVEFHQRLERLLEEEQFASIARLLAQLRGVQLYSCPAQFANPVKLPSTLSPPSSSSHPHLSRPVKSTGATPPQSVAEYISDEDLWEISMRITNDWQHLGIKLNVRYSELESLRTEHHKEPRKAAMQMLRQWQKAKGKAATRKCLREALESLKYGRLAKEIFGNDPR